MNTIATQQLAEISFVLNKLEQENEFAIMNNGEPMAIMFKIPKIKSGFDKTISFIKRLKALTALNEARLEAEARGFLSEEAREKGVAIGMEKGRHEGQAELFALLESGVSLAEARRRLGV